MDGPGRTTRRLRLHHHRRTPSLGLLTDNALLACRNVLIPALPEEASRHALTSCSGTSIRSKTDTASTSIRSVLSPIESRSTARPIGYWSGSTSSTSHSHSGESGTGSGSNEHGQTGPPSSVTRKRRIWTSDFRPSLPTSNEPSETRRARRNPTRSHFGSRDRPKGPHYEVSRGVHSQILPRRLISINRRQARFSVEVNCQYSNGFLTGAERKGRYLR